MKKKAAAVKYDPSLPAPFVLATGRGELADKLVALAQDAGIPAVEHAELAEMLVTLDPGTFIPEELYQLVAELLVFIHTVDNKLRK